MYALNCCYLFFGSRPWINSYCFWVNFTKPSLSSWIFGDRFLRLRVTNSRTSLGFSVLCTPYINSFFESWLCLKSEKYIMRSLLFSITCHIFLTASSGEFRIWKFITCLFFIYLLKRVNTKNELDWWATYLFLPDRFASWIVSSILNRKEEICQLYRNHGWFYSRSTLTLVHKSDLDLKSFGST